MAKKRSPENEEKKRKLTKRTTILLIILSLFLIAFLRTGFIFFILAMLPSIVASFLDHSHSRSTFHTVFACNLSGTLPFIGQIIRNGGEQADVMAIMTDSLSWLVIYASAAFGWLLVFAAPVFATGLINMLHQGQITRLERMQRKIVAEWGHEVENNLQIQEEVSNGPNARS